MRVFEGNINGKIYTDEKEFNKAILELDKSDDVYVSYSYVAASEDINKFESNNYIDENQYVKVIEYERDVEIDDELVNTLKNASNKDEIKKIVTKKISDLQSKIDDNVLYINDLECDLKKLIERISSINNQIDMFKDANNNYYLNQEYYLNIKNLLDENDNDMSEETYDKEECACKHNGGKCKCGDKKHLSIKDINVISPYKLSKFLEDKRIYDLSDLVDYFLKNS